MIVRLEELERVVPCQVELDPRGALVMDPKEASDQKVAVGLRVVLHMVKGLDQNQELARKVTKAGRGKETKRATRYEFFVRELFGVMYTPGVIMIMYHFCHNIMQLPT